MDRQSEGKYSVCELVLDCKDKSYIGYARNGCYSKRNTQAAEYNVYKGDGIWSSQCGKRNDFKSIVELDVVETVDEAIESVEFWQNYYRFLGLNVTG